MHVLGRIRKEVSSMTYITVQDLSVGYEKTAVTEHISFQIDKGDYICIVGENGAGKTTLVKTLLHLIPPVHGNISYGSEISPNEIGYLPQQTVIQRDFPASVWEIVLSGNLSKIGFKPFFGKTEKQAAKENMEKMGIWDLRNKCYRNLSGGQQQRVLLARALCATSKLLLLDEPVSGLDPKVSVELYRLIQTLNEQGTTIIMVSHDIDAACKYASHILHIGKKQLFYGKTEDYLHSNAWKIFGVKEDEEDE